ncbi:MAG: 50S ribosomal protein L10 [Acidimicrobiia bacterium]
MPRPDKVQAVEDIKARIEAAEATFLAEYRGLTVGEQQELRRRLREAQSEFSVVKMSLARLAVIKLGHDELQEWLMGPTAIAFATDDPVLTAKALRDFSEDHEQLVLKAGLLGGQIIEPEQVQSLARIESRDVLLAKVVGTGRASLVQLAGLLSALIRDAASMFRQLADQLEAAEEDAEPAPTTDEPEEPETSEKATEGADEEEATDEEAEAKGDGESPDTEAEGDVSEAAEDDPPEAGAAVASGEQEEQEKQAETEEEE